MVVLLDLDEHALHGDGSECRNSQQPKADWGRCFSGSPSAAAAAISGAGTSQKHAVKGKESSERANPNIGTFAQILGCYPIITQITRSLDLNGLYDLALTCRQVRANILPFRRQLVAQTLQCTNEGLDALPVRPRHDTSLQVRPPYHDDALEMEWKRKVAKRLTRIMDSQNCIVKPPPLSALSGRHRRLCKACLAAPLEQHTLPPFNGCSPPQQIQTRRPAATFTTPSFLHEPCACPDSVWLCQPCGLSLHSADTTYHRVWTWRTRYSAYLGAYLGGGLGTGLVKGTEGVQCGRGGDCLAAKEIEVEVDCDAVDLANAAAAAATAAAAAVAVAVTPDHSGSGIIGRNHHHKARLDEEDDDERGPSYERQEIEGIGGVVKKKIKRMERVGMVVNEWADERVGKGGWLAREKTGEERSWCGWCGRVVPGLTDRKEEEEEEEEGQIPEAEHVKYVK
ncbi:MAG: hypothetical protein M1837_000164 [Sclerophora amabilis]|nr:MAG: hypothetical protein M1837_000164 [Sclerophora amabilis]